MNIDCVYYDQHQGWCKASIDWRDPMPQPAYCTGKCGKYRKLYPYEGCQYAEYFEACGTWCNRKHTWASNMSGEAAICNGCEFNKTGV